ncbi:MAG TPA: aminotransferase class I/II-fold pyridoxal phosphate-dependent enzyme, partial [Polyangiaceae bacterium]|nr:aminotransferase class I/II-fold pyridoxal phosphate-dependent enzyme [Polyangiaceae bacterium]
HAMTHGVVGGSGPWSGQKPKFLCPAPGYDRHFSICEHLGIEMVVVGMNDDGPDMDAVEKLVAADASIKGMWLVPKYSNPGGAVCSDAVVERLASMPTRAPDFRLFWDNAYAVHHLGAGPAKLANVLEACDRAGQSDRTFVFGSTSKVTFAGAGLSAMGGSLPNIDWMRKHRSMMTIGPDKVNQLRHVRLLGDRQGLLEHMNKHAAILAPKFAKVQEVLGKELGSSGLAQWTNPSGGYFVSLDTLDGCAKRVVALANAVGVKLTAAGATFPHGKDPRDRNIRIAPSLPGLAEIEQAMEVLCCCVKLASLEK